MSAVIAEKETKIETHENRTMSERETAEQLRQRQFYRQGQIVDYRDAFDAGWDAGRAFERKERGNGI